MCICINKDQRFTQLGTPNTIWAISAIHGETDRLMTIHDELIERIMPGDRLIYLGNYMGYSGRNPDCIDEILSFRRLLLSRQAMQARDIIYLRGGQEEIWEKLLQLHFAPSPENILLWMLGHGLSTTLEAYNINVHDGLEACRSGSLILTKWINSIRESQRLHNGHEQFHSQLTRAAYTAPDATHPLLFVHSGLDQTRTLEEQDDIFWWGGEQFEQISENYSPFTKVIRGYDPAHKGIMLNCVSATIDGGCGFGGPLIGIGISSTGDIEDIIEA